MLYCVSYYISIMNRIPEQKIILIPDYYSSEIKRIHSCPINVNRKNQWDH